MKTTMKKIMSLILGILLIMSAVPGRIAAESTEYPLWVGGNQVTSEHTFNLIEGWTFEGDAEGGTLTLKDAGIVGTYDYIDPYGGSSPVNIFADEGFDLEIVVRGTCKLGADGSEAMCGIYAKKSLTITGSGKLVALASIVGLSSPDFTIKDTTVDVTGGRITIGADSLKISNSYVIAQATEQSGYRITATQFKSLDLEGAEVVTPNPYEIKPYMDQTAEKSIYAWGGNVPAKKVVIEPCYTVKVSANPAEGGAVNGGGSFSLSGTGTATVTAMPNQGYKFVNWTENGTAVSTESSMSFQVDRNRDLVANFEKLKYTVRFLNYNNAELQNSQVEYGETPVYTGETPEREETPQYFYSFAGWTPQIVPVTGNADYTATYDQTVRKYTIKFVNFDDTELQNSEVAFGETPVYTGATPEREKSAQYTYNFIGWTPEIVSVIGPATYMATYEPIVNKYTIEFVNYDGTVLQSSKVAYGDTPKYTGATPLRDPDNYNEYSFKGWDPEITSVTGKKTYTAAYEEIPIYHAVEVYCDEAMGTVSADKTQGQYGQEVTLNATPKEGHDFVKWEVVSGDVEVIDGKFTIGTKDVKIRGVFEAFSYDVTKGGNGSYTKGGKKDYVIVVKRSRLDDACFDRFTAVEIDGNELSQGSEYTAEAGSTVIRIKASTLNALSKGKHVITVYFEDGKAETSLKIKNPSSSEPSTPETVPETSYKIPKTGID